MYNKEMERRNFLKWYCCYATIEEIEKAKGVNKEALERLINEYSAEIDRINKSRHVYDFTVKSRDVISDAYPASCV